MNIYLLIWIYFCIFKSKILVLMMNFYCIDFEEGCRSEPCPECCKNCEGWSAKSAMPDSKPNKSEPDVNAEKLY